MPPKKAATTNGEPTEGVFKWEGANDFKLLLLIQGRHAMPDEYERLATAFPDVSTGGIRNRISNLRVKQRELYETLGWTLPESVAANARKRGAKTGRKRSVEESEDGVEAEAETPRKKQRKPASKKVKKEEEGDAEAEAQEEVVKEV